MKTISEKTVRFLTKGVSILSYPLNAMNLGGQILIYSTQDASAIRKLRQRFLEKPEDILLGYWER